jgi:hypothetical protein
MEELITQNRESFIDYPGFFSRRTAEKKNNTFFIDYPV